MSGELLSLLVAVMWTFTALFAEVASKRMGTLVLNVWRMLLTILLLGIVLWWTCGKPWPQYANTEVWKWFLASGFMGFVFGDYCLFNAYIVMGSRFGQLFMTLASPFAAIAAWLMMGETMGMLALLGMIVTLSGIGISIICSQYPFGSNRCCGYDAFCRHSDASCNGTDWFRSNTNLLEEMAKHASFLYRPSRSSRCDGSHLARSLLWRKSKPNGSWNDEYRRCSNPDVAHTHSHFVALQVDVWYENQHAGSGRSSHCSSRRITFLPLKFGQSREKL